jgi:hypothetical protein
MPLDVRLKHLIGLVGEIRQKPLIYAIPVVGMNHPDESGGHVPMYRSIAQGCGAVQNTSRDVGWVHGTLGFPRNHAGAGNVITWQLKSSSGTRTKGSMSPLVQGLGSEA